MGTAEVPAGRPDDAERPDRSTEPTEEELLRTAVRRLNARAWGIAFGLLAGGGLFLATAILVIRGGPDPGAHLSLLSNYFPGYRVTWAGSFLGFVYAFVLGYGAYSVVSAVV